jgi:methanogenic corrinoid protein MtbC1
VIRAWEKRYGAVTPHRTETNRRLYSQEDVERLSLLRRSTLLGRSIGQIAKLPTEELRRLVAEDEAAQRAASPTGAPEIVPTTGHGARILSACLEAAKELDASRLQHELDSAVVTLSRPVLMSDVVVPLMQSLGNAWREGSVRVAHEHLATAVVRTFVGSLNGAFQVSANAPRIVVTTPSGQLHEIGALLAAATAAADGWRTTYLGPSLPAEEIAGAARQNEARAVALSIVYPTDDAHVASELKKLRKFLPPSTKIIVGGRGASSYRQVLDEIGAAQPAELESLIEELQTLRG